MQIMLDKVAKNLEDKDDVEMRDKVKLQSDIYSYTFWKCATSDDTHRLADLFNKCYLTVMIQVLISWYKLYETWTEKEIYLGSNMLNMVRFICAYIMHI